MSGNMLGHDAECDCGPCDNERMQKYLTRNSPCNFCLPTRKKQAARIGELEKQNAELKAEIAELRNQILDTGPMLPKKGVTDSAHPPGCLFPVGVTRRG